MSSGITDAGANAFADHFTGVTSLGSPFYVALCFVEPDVATDGTALATIEPSGGSYARQSLPRNSTNWSVADQGITATLLDLTFPTATADWGIITHYALCTAASAGAVLGFGILSSEQRVMSGDQLVLPAGGISLGYVGPQNAMNL
jgi:hypothetical protein